MDFSPESFSDEELLVVVDPDDGIPETVDSVDFDAILVGGSKNVSAEETVETIRTLREDYSVPVYQEPGSRSQVNGETVMLSDGVIASMTLNADLDEQFDQHISFFNQLEAELAELYGSNSDEVAEASDQILDEKYIPQAYLLMNSDCDAAEVTGVTENDIPGLEELRNIARTARGLLDAPILYIEGSGHYTGPEPVEEINRFLDDTHLRYGGGIEDQRQIDEILDAGADSVVIGTAIEQDSYNEI